jgi:hypothetical protein
MKGRRVRSARSRAAPRGRNHAPSGGTSPGIGVAQAGVVRTFEAATGYFFFLSSRASLTLLSISS